ncbi:MAG: hypothetical protein JO299_02890 [Gammaproteobacteria bacterium]|nr:hypothetical protein [Gammaproteobacteria bacterium]
MNFSDETVMSYVDGELDEPTRTAIEAALASDPTLVQRVARQRALLERLHQGLDPVLQEPLPERLLAAARGKPSHPGKVSPLRLASRPRWSWPQWGAMAASLCVGILIAPLLWRQPTEAFVTRDGRILATGPLAHALSEQLASNQAADALVHIGVSFLSRSGDYCRTFVVRDRGALAGLACREQERWVLTALADSRSRDTSGDYRPAASSLPPSVAAAVSDLIAGEPLDAGAEARARANGWHRQ